MKTHAKELNGVRVSWFEAGSGPALLLLHGFPQTKALWGPIVPQLARAHRVICPDLRGYGDSGKPKGVAAYSFRDMGRDLFALMDHLGIARCAIAGHDRGARVAHRMALDAPERVRRLCLMDIIPTHTLLTDLSTEVATSYYHWFFLAQPHPLPERMIGADPEAYYESCLLGWGGAGLERFHPDCLRAYRKAWADAPTRRAMCDDYRAALQHDWADDAADLDQRVACPTLVLYGEDGIMGCCYDVSAVWAKKCDVLTAEAMPGGHFFPDTHPDATAARLAAFLDKSDDGSGEKWRG